MEVEMLFTTDEDETYCRLMPPCRGYYTDWEFWIWFGDDDKFNFINIGKDLVIGIDILDALGSIALPSSKTGQNIMLKVEEPVDAHIAHRFYSKKKIYINDKSETINVTIDESDSGEGILVLFARATFVPFAGEVIKVRHTIIGDGETDAADAVNQFYVAPFDAELVGVKVDGYAGESGQGQSVIEFRCYSVDQETFGFDDNFTIVEGDVFELDPDDDLESEVNYGGNEILSFTAIVGDISANIANHGRITGGWSGKRKISEGDILYFLENALLNEGTPDNTRIFVDYFFKIKKSSTQMEKSSKVSYFVNSSGELPDREVTDYFVDHGYVEDAL